MLAKKNLLKNLQNKIDYIYTAKLLIFIYL